MAACRTSRTFLNIENNTKGSIPNRDDIEKLHQTRSRRVCQRVRVLLGTLEGRTLSLWTHISLRSGLEAHSGTEWCSCDADSRSAFHRKLAHPASNAFRNSRRTANLPAPGLSTVCRRI